MENAEPEEPEKKRPHLDSPAMARSSSTSPSNNDSVDAAVLQYQNQRLVQQLDVQKHALHDLEMKINELKDKRTSYDEMLISVNQLWTQLVDDLILLGARAGIGLAATQALVQAENSRGSIPPCPVEEMFLCRLLRINSIDSNGGNGTVSHIEEALASRHSFTLELMKSVEDTISAESVRTKSIAQAFSGKASAEEASVQLAQIDDMMKDEAKNLREMIDFLHLKHKEYADLIQMYTGSLSIDECEIKRLEGEMEEIMADLEESRRKLINLKIQKEVALGAHASTAIAANGSLSPEKPTDKAMGLRDLKDSIEETKIVAADRLSELEAAKEQNLIYLKQMQDLQDELKDEKFVLSSRLYALLNEQLQHWNAELGRYQSLTDLLQVDRSLVTRREKESLVTRRENELSIKVESLDAARSTNDNGDSRIEELEIQLQKCMSEKNELEIKLEETLQDSGRNDIKAEFGVMASALSKEMAMMEAQLNQWKETAEEAIALRDEAVSLKSLLDDKIKEQKSLAEKCSQQFMEIKSLKGLIENLQKEKLELQIFLDMYGQDSNDNRDLMDIRESEQRARSQAEVLRSALDEHSLELRVKAANEAEVACQRRLSVAEAEIADLRAKLDASARDVLELTEAIRSKDRESDAYISEIETIGQAYEDMQTQNQHLLQQMTERDDYNIKLVSESVKTKQAHGVLASEKQALSKQLKEVNTLVESVKVRIAQSEEQMKVCLAEAVNFTQDERHLALSLEIAKWELVDAEKELKCLKSATSSSEKDYEHVQRKTDECQTKLDKERSQRKKLEEELEELNCQIAELSSESGETAIQRLQDEIKRCKNILKCSVCDDRPKEVVIVKCYHLFCHPCIQRNLEIRLRKCPCCATAFGQNDVRFVKI